LIDGHLSGVALDKLNETAALSWRDLDVGNLAKALEERAKLVLGNITGQATDEDGGVVRIGELIHRLRCAIVTQWRGSTHAIHSWGCHIHWVSDLVWELEEALLKFRDVTKKEYRQNEKEYKPPPPPPPIPPCIGIPAGPPPPDLFLGVAVEIRIGRFPQ
jgi:hypothetical protein